jgi:ABC-type transport system involved in multi-copper enzyme maturation permease subunit
MGVFVHDLRRTTRRGRVALLRGAYGLTLLVALAGVYVSWFPGRLTLAGLFAPGPELSPRELARFAEQFAAVALLVQFAAVLLLTPAAVAGAVAGERQRGTLDLLLTSRLSAAEIVLGKLVSRGLFLLGLLLTGLPVLALTLLFGGVDPWLVGGGVILAAAYCAALAGLSLYCSVMTQSVAGAVIATYALAVGLATLTAPFTLALISRPPAGAADRWGPRVDYLAADVLMLAGTALGSLVAAVFALRRAAGPPGSRVEPAGARLRELPPAPRVRAVRWPDTLPPVGDDPLPWKERYFGADSASGGLLHLVGFLVPLYAPVFATGLLVGAMIGPEAVRFWTGVLTVGLLAWCAVGPGLAAAVAVCSERERRTLDALLVLPGPRTDLLRAKWLGSVRHGRGPAVELLVLWWLMAVAGVLPITGLLLLPLAGAAHVAFAVSLGLWVSVRAQSTGRALMAVGLCLLAVSVVPPLAADYWAGLAGPELAQSVPWVGPLLADGLSPPVVWWRLAVPASESRGPALSGIVIGSWLYVLAAWRLWSRACARLQREG